MDLIKKLGFREADEMDTHIAQIAAQISWATLTAALLIWSLYGLIQSGTITPPFILLGLGLAVYFATMIFLRKKLSNGHQE